MVGPEDWAGSLVDFEMVVSLFDLHSVRLDVIVSRNTVFQQWGEQHDPDCFVCRNNSCETTKCKEKALSVSEDSLEGGKRKAEGGRRKAGSSRQKQKSECCISAQIRSIRQIPGSNLADRYDQPPTKKAPPIGARRKRSWENLEIFS